MDHVMEPIPTGTGMLIGWVIFDALLKYINF